MNVQHSLKLLKQRQEIMTMSHTSPSASSPPAVGCQLIEGLHASSQGNTFGDHWCSQTRGFQYNPLSFPVSLFKEVLPMKVDGLFSKWCHVKKKSEPVAFAHGLQGWCYWYCHPGETSAWVERGKWSKSLLSILWSIFYQWKWNYNYNFRCTRMQLMFCSRPNWCTWQCVCVWVFLSSLHGTW